MTDSRPLMEGKKGLIMGVANDRSIAWGIARVLHGQGAELAFSYQGGAFGRRAGPLAESIGAKIIQEARVGALESVKRVCEGRRREWGWRRPARPRPEPPGRVSGCRRLSPAKVVADDQADETGHYFGHFLNNF